MLWPTVRGVTQGDIEKAVESAMMRAAEEAARPFRIGVMESVTGPGETYGNVAVQAKQMAVEEINAAGGVNGRKIELIVEDSKCNAQDSITAYRKLTDVDGVKIILGTSCSGAMLGAAPLAEEDGVILFSGLATNPDIANAGDYIFRTSMSDAQLGVDTGNTVWADGLRTLATITEATDYAEGVRRTSVEQFEKLGRRDRRRRKIRIRCHGFQVAVDQAAQRKPRRAAHSGAIGIHRRHHCQAGQGTWI